MAWDSNPGSPDPEATELTTRPGRIVMQELRYMYIWNVLSTAPEYSSLCTSEITAVP